MDNMNTMNFHFKFMIIIAFSIGLYNFQSTCNTQIVNDDVYALCQGQFTIDNASATCNFNGYMLVADNDSIYSIINSIFK